MSSARVILILLFTVLQSVAAEEDSSRSLDAWFRLHCHEIIHRQTVKSRASAILIRAGTNAAPVLAEGLAVHSEPFVKSMYQKLRSELPESLARHLPMSANPTLIRQTAAELFVKNPDAAKLAIPNLIIGVGDTNSLVKHFCLQALIQINNGNPEIDQAIVKASTDFDLLQYAVMGLEYTCEATPEVKAAANVARSKITDPGMLEFIQDPDTTGMTFPEPESPEECLKHLNRIHHKQRLKAIKKLGKIHPKTERMVTAFLNSLGDEHEGVHVAAFGNLSKLGPDVRIKTIDFLSSNVRQHSTTIPLLATFLSDSESSVKRAAIAAISTFGSQADRIAPQLQELLKDRDPLVAAAAQQALGKINQRPPSKWRSDFIRSCHLPFDSIFPLTRAPSPSSTTPRLYFIIQITIFTAQAPIGSIVLCRFA